MIIFEVLITVAVPVELIHDELKIVVLAFGHILDQEAPRHHAPLDQGLVHAKDVTAPLWFVSAKASGGVKDAGRDQPTCSRPQAICPAQVKDSVISLVPVFETFADLGPGGA